MDFHGLKRKELQELCKKHGIPANLKNVEMIDRLSSLLLKEEKPENAVQRGRARSCLKSVSEVVEEGIVENDTKEVKKVRFSPENQTFLFEKSDPRAVRLMARKKRAFVKLGQEQNPVVDSSNLVESQGLGVVSDDVGEIGGNVGRRSSLRRKSVVVSEDIGLVGENDGKVGELGVKGGNLGRNLRRKSVVVAENVGLVGDNDEKVRELGVEGGNFGRNLRFRRGKSKEESSEMVSLLSPCGLDEGDAVVKGQNLRRSSRRSMVQKADESLVGENDGKVGELGVKGGNLGRNLMRKSVVVLNSVGLAGESDGEVGVKGGNLGRDLSRKSVVVAENVGLVGGDNDEKVRELGVEGGNFGRNLRSQRGKSKEESSEIVSLLSPCGLDEGDAVVKGQNLRRSSRRSMVQKANESLVCEDDDQMEKLPVKRGLSERNLRSREENTKQETVEVTSLLSPHGVSNVDKKPVEGGNVKRTLRSRGGKIDEKTVEDVAFCGVDSLKRKTDGGGNLKRSLRSKRGKADEETLENASLLSPSGIDKLEKKPVEGGNLKRSLRSRGGQTKDNGAEAVSLLSPHEVNKAKKSRKGKKIAEKGGCEGDDRPHGEMVDQGGNDGRVTRRRLRSREVASEELKGDDISEYKNPQKRSRPRKSAKVEEKVTVISHESISICENSSEDVGEGLAENSPERILEKTSRKLGKRKTLISKRQDIDESDTKKLDAVEVDRLSAGSSPARIVLESSQPKSDAEVREEKSNVKDVGESAIPKVQTVAADCEMTPLLQTIGDSGEDAVREIPLESIECTVQKANTAPLSVSKDSLSLRRMEEQYDDSSFQQLEETNSRDLESSLQNFFSEDNSAEDFQDASIERAGKPEVDASLSELVVGGNNEDQMHDAATCSIAENQETDVTESYDASGYSIPTVESVEKLQPNMAHEARQLDECLADMGTNALTPEKAESIFCIPEEHNPLTPVMQRTDNDPSLSSMDAQYDTSNVEGLEQSNRTFESSLKYLFSEDVVLNADDSKNTEADNAEDLQHTRYISQETKVNVSHSEEVVYVTGYKNMDEATEQVNLAHKTFTQFEESCEEKGIDETIPSKAELNILTPAKDNDSMPFTMQNSGYGPCLRSVLGNYDKLAVEQLEHLTVESGSQYLVSEDDCCTDERNKSMKSEKDDGTEGLQYTRSGSQVEFARVDASLSEKEAYDNERQFSSSCSFGSNLARESRQSEECCQEEGANEMLSENAELNSLTPGNENNPTPMQSEKADAAEDMQCPRTAGQIAETKIDGSLSEQVAQEIVHYCFSSSSLQSSLARDTTQPEDCCSEKGTDELTPENAELNSLTPERENNSTPMKSEKADGAEDLQCTRPVGQVADTKVDGSLSEQVAHDIEHHCLSSSSLQSSLAHDTTHPEECCSEKGTDETTPENAELNSLTPATKNDSTLYVMQPSDNGSCLRSMKIKSDKSAVGELEQASISRFCESSSKHLFSEDEILNTHESNCAKSKVDGGEEGLQNTRSISQAVGTRIDASLTELVASDHELQSMKNIIANDEHIAVGLINKGSEASMMMNDDECTKEFALGGSTECGAFASSKTLVAEHCYEDGDSTKFKRKDENFEAVTELPLEGSVSLHVVHVTIQSETVSEAKGTVENISARAKVNSQTLAKSDCSLHSTTQISDESDNEKEVPLEVVAIADNNADEDVSVSSTIDEDCRDASEAVDCNSESHMTTTNCEALTDDKEHLFNSSNELKDRMRESITFESNEDLLKEPVSENEKGDGDTILNSALIDDKLTLQLTEQVDVAGSTRGCDIIIGESDGSNWLNAFVSLEKETMASKGSEQGRVESPGTVNESENTEIVTQLENGDADCRSKNPITQSTLSVTTSFRQQEVVGECTLISHSMQNEEEINKETTKEEVKNSIPKVEHVVSEDHLMNFEDEKCVQSEKALRGQDRNVVALGKDEAHSGSSQDMEVSDLELLFRDIDNCVDLNCFSSESISKDIDEMLQAAKSMPYMAQEKISQYDQGELVESEAHGSIPWDSKLKLHHKVAPVTSLDHMDDRMAGQNQAKCYDGFDVQGSCAADITENVFLSMEDSYCFDGDKKPDEIEEFPEEGPKNCEDSAVVHEEAAILEDGSGEKLCAEADDEITDTRVTQQNGNENQVNDQTYTACVDVCNNADDQLPSEQTVDLKNLPHDTIEASDYRSYYLGEKSRNSEATNQENGNQGNTQLAEWTVSEECADRRIDLVPEDAAILRENLLLLKKADSPQTPICDRNEIDSAPQHINHGEGLDTEGARINVTSDAVEKDNTNAQDERPVDATEREDDMQKLKRRNRSILLLGTPRKPQLPKHDMKENMTAPKRLQMVNATLMKPKRKALGDI